MAVPTLAGNAAKSPECAGKTGWGRGRYRSSLRVASRLIGRTCGGLTASLWVRTCPHGPDGGQHSGDIGARALPGAVPPAEHPWPCAAKMPVGPEALLKTRGSNPVSPRGKAENRGSGNEVRDRERNGIGNRLARLTDRERAATPPGGCPEACRCGRSRRRASRESARRRWPGSTQTERTRGWARAPSTCLADALPERRAGSGRGGHRRCSVGVGEEIDGKVKANLSRPLEGSIRMNSVPRTDFPTVQGTVGAVDGPT